MKFGEDGDSDFLSYILEKIISENKNLESVFRANFSFTAAKCKCPKSTQELGEIENLVFIINPENDHSLEKHITTIKEICHLCRFRQEIQYEFKFFPKILIIALNNRAGSYEKFMNLLKIFINQLG